MKKIPIPNSVLPTLSGLLLALGWPSLPFPMVLWVAWIPLLIYAEKLKLENKKWKGLLFWFQAFWACLIWNTLTTWWIWNSTKAGAVFSIIANAALMSIPLILWFTLSSRMNRLFSGIAWVCFFVSFEWAHLNWDLSWPWLTLGNGWASLPQLVQWYEWTGALGGSAWILALNFLIWQAWFDSNRKPQAIKWSILVMVVPVFISLIRYWTYSEKGPVSKVAVVQPNIDPLQEKFRGSPKFIPYQEQRQRLFKLSASILNPHIDFILWPETAIPSDIDEANLDKEPEILELRAFADNYPQTQFITGASGYRFLKPSEPIPPIAFQTDLGMHYLSFNSAYALQKGMPTEIYHKSKLVPGTESLPYPAVFGILVAELDGIVGSVATQEKRSVFTNANKPEAVGAPIICYESVFGAFVGEYVKAGATLFFIITNDGWWENTEGHRQHFQYARLRAVEHRRSVARAANTGVSGFINQRGDVLAASTYWTAGAWQHELKANKHITLYSSLGDWPAYLALSLSFILFIASLFRMAYVTKS